MSAIALGPVDEVVIREEKEKEGTNVCNVIEKEEKYFF